MTAASPTDAAHQWRELLEISRLIASSLDLDIVLATVAKQAAALLRAEAAALLLREGAILRMQAGFQIPEEVRRLEVPVGPGVMATIREIGHVAGLEECVGVPLVLRGETVGVLAAYRRIAAAETTDDEVVLSALADQAAVAVENARIYGQLERQKEALQESEARFRLAFDEAPIGVALVGLDGRILRVNNVLCEMVGYSTEELSVLRFDAITHPEDVEVDVHLADALGRGELPRYQLGKRFVRKDGAVIDTLLSVSMVRNAEGSPSYSVRQIEDVTERKRAESKLRRSEAQFRGLIERLPDGVFIHRSGRVAYANQALASLLGHANPGALRDAPLTRLYHPDDMPTVLARIERVQSGSAAPPRELRVVRRDGSFCEVESTAIQVQFEEGPAMIVILRDLSERKAADRERQEAYERLRVIIDLAPVGIMVSVDAEHWDANARAQQLFGCPVECLTDASRYSGDLLDNEENPIHFEELPSVRALRGEHFEGVEMRLQRPDGQVVPILVSAAGIPGGSTTPPGAVVVFEDISALKELERLRIEWGAVVAHDLRQPLNSIALNAELVTQEARADLPLRQRAQKISALAQRLSRMVQDLVDFTRLEARQLTLSRRSVELTKLVEEATERIALEAPDRPIQLRLRGPPLNLDVDADRLAQVMDNLLTNAVKYGDPGTPIRVCLESSAGQVSVSVTNQGPGIAPEQIPHLFGRFQRAQDTQGRGAKGIGLGLYITRELIEAHQGRIVAESVPGKLTTFRFTLPLPQ